MKEMRQNETEFAMRQICLYETEFAIQNLLSEDCSGNNQKFLYHVNISHHFVTTFYVTTRFILNVLRTFSTGRLYTIRIDLFIYNSISQNNT